MQYINLTIHALTPAVAPLLQHVWEGRGRNRGTVISIFIPLSFKSLSNTTPFWIQKSKINKPPSFNHAASIQLILKIMNYIAFLQYFNKI
jgi:hypothetical protein